MLLVLNVAQLPFYAAVVIAVATGGGGIVAVAWARAGAELVHTVLVAVTASRALGTRVLSFLAATAPAAAAGLGVLVGAGLVRLGWRDLSLLPLLAGSAAGAAGGVVALRLLAPGAFAELRGQLTAVLRMVRRARPAEG